MDRLEFHDKGVGTPNVGGFSTCVVFGAYDLLTERAEHTLQGLRVAIGSAGDSRKGVRRIATIEYAGLHYTILDEDVDQLREILAEWREQTKASEARGACGDQEPALPDPIPTARKLRRFMLRKLLALFRRRPLLFVNFLVRRSRADYARGRENGIRTTQQKLQAALGLA